jgi:hypothetical protein
MPAASGVSEQRQKCLRRPTWNAALELSYAFGDMLRICRLEEIIAESFGVSLAVLLSADVVGNLAEAGLTIAGASTPSSSNV